MTVCPYPATLTSSAGSIVLNDAFDAYGFWTWSDLKGWFGNESLRQTLLDPAGADGQVVAENRKGAKSVVLVGFAGAADAHGWYVAANRLEAVTDALVGVDGTLALAEPTGPRTLTVQLAPGGLGVARSGMLTRVGAAATVNVGFTFQVPLFAADPTKS